MRIAKFVLLLAGLLVSLRPDAQKRSNDPTGWTYEVKKKSGSEYELIFHMTLNKGWHVYSLKPGDEAAIPPSFTFNKNASVSVKGNVREVGKKIEHAEKELGITVYYFADKVDFVQTVSVKGKTKITGKHEYQVCNDQVCLPPMTRDFVFEIK